MGREHRCPRPTACEGIRRLTNEVGGQVLCYHSRFTLDDRKKWHGEVVDAFQAIR